MFNLTLCVVYVCVDVWNNMQRLMFRFIFIQPSRRGQMQPGSQFEVLIGLGYIGMQELSAFYSNRSSRLCSTNKQYTKHTLMSELYTAAVIIVVIFEVLDGVYVSPCVAVRLSESYCYNPFK